MSGGDSAFLCCCRANPIKPSASSDSLPYTSLIPTPPITTHTHTHTRYPHQAQRARTQTRLYTLIYASYILPAFTRTDIHPRQACGRQERHRRQTAVDSHGGAAAARKGSKQVTLKVLLLCSILVHARAEFVLEKNICIVN